MIHWCVVSKKKEKHTRKKGVAEEKYRWDVAHSDLFLYGERSSGCKKVSYGEGKGGT